MPATVAAWTLTTLPASVQWTQVAHGNGTFVAISNGSATIATSPDGISWTPRDGIAADAWQVVAYGNGRWVVMANSSTLVSTNNGQTWTRYTNALNKTFSHVVYGAGPGLFVAAVIAATDNKCWSSPDGITWTQRTLPSTQTNWTGLAYGAGRFVISSGTTGYTAWSTDGQGWNAATTPHNVTVRAIAYGSGKFVAVGDYQNIATSPNGNTWTNSGSPILPNDAAKSVTFANGFFVSVATANGAPATLSADGSMTVAWSTLNFPALTPPNPSGWHSVAGSPVGTFVALPNKVSDTVAVSIPATRTPGVSTLAGSGTFGFADGTGTAAQFHTLYGGTVDPSSGDVLVADSGANRRIRRVSPSGVVATFAGSGATGHSDGPALSATFTYPCDIAIDSTGNVYVLDYSGNRIRKIDQSGTVTTFAGDGTAASLDGTGTGARFNLPFGMCYANDGNLYVAEAVGCRVRKVTTAGVVTTLAGSGTSAHVDGTGTGASFTEVDKIVQGSDGHLYVTDSSGGTVRRVTLAGVVTTIAGQPGVQADADGTGTAATFNRTHGIAADKVGNLYVGTRYALRKIRLSDNQVTTIAGSTDGYVDGTLAAARFRHQVFPLGMHPSGQFVYVVEGSGYTVREVVPAADAPAVAQFSGFSMGA